MNRLEIRDKKTLKAYRIDLAQFQAFILEYPDFEDKNAINDYISSLHDSRPSIRGIL